MPSGFVGLSAGQYLNVFGTVTPGDGGGTGPTVSLSAGQYLNVYGTVTSGPGTPANPMFDPVSATSPYSVDFGALAATTIPAPSLGEGTKSLWVLIEPSQRATLSASFAADQGFFVGFELWAVPTDEPLTDVEDATFLDAEGGSTFTFPVGEGGAYLLRVYPIDAGDDAGTGTLTWSLTPRADGDIQLDSEPVAYDSPAWLRISVFSATEDGDIEFDIAGQTVITLTADESGRVVDESVPVPDLPTGTYVLVARDVTTGQESSVTFGVEQLTNDPSADPPPAGPTIPPTSEAVVRWVFELPAPGAEVYVFPNNPQDMSSPHAERVLNADHTTAPDGQALLFEGEPVPVQWTVSGFCFDQDHYEALEHWQSLNRRFFAVDHLQRAWVVTFESLDWTPVRDPQRPWAHRYTAKFLVYEGPVPLP